MAQPTIQPPPEPSLVDAAAARVGQRLNASWMLDEVLGVGGVAAVFAGTHADGGRAALKVLHASLTREPEIRERFLREGRIADQVDHPGRVRVLGDEVSDQGEPFLILELLAGTTLQRLLRRPGEALPLEQALAVFDAVLDLLERCHAAGIVHRDIKPANIFITSSGQVKVLDFGFARMREEGGRATRVGLTYGTPAFMAPEQAMALGTVDGRADLWSVGACMYAALSGKPVREGRTEAESHLLAATQPARSLARVASQMPLETVAFVDRALAFDRGRRFQTAAEMRAELRGLRAAHAAGRLTAGGQARGPGVVLRANDTVAPPDPREDAAPRVAAFFRQLAVVLSSARQYGWSHPFVGRGLGAALEEVHRALAEDPAGLRWDVVPGAFTVGGQPVWQPDRPPFDRIPYQLFADGLRSIQLKPGITDVELRDFAAILLRDHSFGGDEDSITALWDRRFEHVAYLAVDSFSAGDAQTEAIDEAGLALCRGLARIDRLWIDRLWDEGSLEGRSMQRNLEATARARGFRAGGPPSVTDELTARTLGAQVSIPFEEWRERFMDAFVDGYLEAERRGDTASLLAALTEWTADQIVLHDLTPAFEVHAALRRAFSARAEVSLPLPLIHRAITAAMFPQGALRAILEELADHGPDEPARGEDASYARQAAGLPPPPPPVPPGVAEGLSLALEVEVEGALFTAVCDSYAAVQSDRVREVLLGYLTRWAPGREAELAEILPRAPAPLALTILRLLSGLRTPEAAAALEAALGSQHISVRINALALLPDAGRAEGEPRSRGQASGDRIRDELGRLLEAPDPAARVEALRTIARLGLVAAGPTLVRHIQATSFHERPPEERRQWLDTVVRLNPVRAERLAIDLLERRQLLPSDAIEQTREIAVIVLASFASSEDALAVVKEATKPRWGSSPGVRDAAARAVPAIAARLARRRSAEPASDAGALSRRASTLPPPATVPPPSVPASVRKP